MERGLLTGAATMKALPRVILALALAAPACVLDKEDADKGVVDDSAPPSGAPDSAGVGKADGTDKILEVSLESAHPYANDEDRTYRLELNAVPACASRVRVHFAALRLEADYDFLYVQGGVDEQLQRFTGRRDDSWTDWVMVDDQNLWVDLRLETDYSVTDHGFVIDAVEWDGQPICPAVVWPACPTRTVDINTPPGACGCPRQPVCADLDEVEIQVNRFRGFDNLGRLTRGTDAFTLAPGPADGLEETAAGMVHAAALAQVVRAAAAAGLFESAGYERGDFSGYSVYLALRAEGREIVFRAPEGTHDAAVQAVIDAFLALFPCDGTVLDRGCGGGQGDFCGGLLGQACADGFKCRYQDSGFGVPYPDEGGTCVAATYCDAPPDCAGLPHVAVPGAWACNDNQCAWQPGPAWQAVDGWKFETWHPYGNRANLWQKLYLPAGASAMRLMKQGTLGFHLEQGYDFLEVWTWQNGAWRQVARYTGGNGPQPMDEFAGRYHYLHFVSDASVTDVGFHLGAEYRN